jgi:UDP:flavonoid glycosyltransferase YjiC (YdhE family)
MNILFTTQPAYGHLHPMVPLGRALARFGHDVRVMSSRSFQPQLSASGLVGIVGGMDWLESDIAGGFPEYAEHRARGESKRYLQSEIFGWQTARAMASDIESVAKGWRVDVIVREPWEFGGAVAAAKLGVPCVLHGVGSAANVEEVFDLAGDRLRELGNEAGFEGLHWLSGATYIDPCPPSLQEQSPSFHPEHNQPIRPEPFDTTDGATVEPAWLDGLGERPVVYVGLGTVMNRWGGLLERIVEDLRQIEGDIVVTTGPGRDPSDLGAQPDHVHVEEYVPLTVLFPRCDVVVCHAGWGTTIAALSHGLPLLAVPLGADGPRTAARVVQLGIGALLKPDEVPPGVISAHVTKLITDPSYRRAAKTAQDQIDQMPTPDIAARCVEAAAS